MFINRSFRLVAVFTLLAVVALSSGIAAAAPATGPAPSVAANHCLATLRQELGAVMPSSVGFQESTCSAVDPSAGWSDAGASGRGPAVNAAAPATATSGWSEHGASYGGPAVNAVAPATVTGRGPYASPQASSVTDAL